MSMKLSRWLDTLSEFFAHRKGMLLMIGMLLILVNGVLQFIPAAGMLAETNLLLHIGLILALLGILLAWAL